MLSDDYIFFNLGDKDDDEPYLYGVLAFAKAGKEPPEQSHIDELAFRNYWDKGYDVFTEGDLVEALREEGYDVELLVIPDDARFGI